MTQTLETKLKNEVMLWCGEHGYIVIRLNSGKGYNGDIFNSPEYGKIIINPRFIKLCNEGTTDLLVIMPHRIAFVETKVHPRKPTQEQIKFINHMKSLGHIAGTVYSIDELIELLK